MLARVGGGLAALSLAGILGDQAQADAGDGLAVARINGVRYERQLIRIKAGPVLDGIVAKLVSKYGPGATREAIEAGDVWIFEMAPRGV